MSDVGSFAETAAETNNTSTLVHVDTSAALTCMTKPDAPAAPGWDAIDRALQAQYGSQEPWVWRTIQPFYCPRR